MFPVDSMNASSSALFPKSPIAPMAEKQDCEQFFVQSLAKRMDEISLEQTKSCKKSLKGRVSPCPVDRKFDFFPLDFLDEADFLSALQSGDPQHFENLLKTKKPTQNLLYMGLKTAFSTEKLDEFKIICNFLEADPLIIEELFYLEIARGGSSFLSFLVTKFRLTQDILHRALDTAILHRNYSALQFLSDCEIDRHKLLNYLIIAIEDYDFSLAVMLFSLDVEDSYRRAAFMKACKLENMEFIKQFVSMGINPVFMGEAFLDAVYEKKANIIFLLVNLGLHTSFIDLGLEFLAIETDEDLFFSLMDCGPSREGVVQALYSATSVGEERLVHRLVQRFNFTPYEIIHAARLALSHDYQMLGDFLRSFLGSIEYQEDDEEVEWESVSWSVNLDTIPTDPQRFLTIWSEFDPKPTNIRFIGEHGFGEGLTREFYSRLCEGLFQRMFDEEGLPIRGERDPVSFNHLASLLSWMADHQLKMGKLFKPRWLKILQFIQLRNGFVRSCFPLIYSNFIDSSRLQRSKIYSFLDTPDEKNKKALLETFDGEIRFLGFEVLEKDEQQKMAKEFLIEKFGDRCLVDFLEGNLEEAPQPSFFKEIAQKVILTCYGESMDDLKEIMNFCTEVRKDFWKRCLEIFKFSKIFLHGCSPKLIEMIRTKNLEPLEGEPLENLYKLDFVYSGSDAAIHEKIALVKDLIFKKCEKKDYDWLKSFVYFIGGGAGFTLDKPLRILEIAKEAHPQSQTCFFLLKLARGYDAYPKILPDWQKRFQAKLEEAIKVKGYQLEESD